MNQHLPLRLLLVFDAAFLLTIGSALVLAPGKMLQAFHYPSMPPSVHFIMAMWGCVLATLGLGYLHSAFDPVRNIAWIQVGIARGTLEFVVSIVYVVLGLTSLSQVWPGLLMGGFVALGYLTLYPKPN